MSKLIHLSALLEQASAIPQPVDVKITPNDRFEVMGEGPTVDIVFADRSVGALPMYQMKSLAGAPGIDLRGTSPSLRSARRGSLESLMLLRRQATELNAALRLHDHSAKPLLARTSISEEGNEYIGGIVSHGYTPVTHVELIELMMNTGGFDGANIARMDISAARMEATVVLHGQSEWKVDGGVKVGLFIGNGQFGDRALDVEAMLFRLLCTNGMKSILGRSGVNRRHIGQRPDFGAEIAEVMRIADGMFEIAGKSMSIEVNVKRALVDLHRRGYIGRGALRKALERGNESFDGVGVSGATTTQWGLAQAVSAAARDYAFTQMDGMNVLAGRIVGEGVVRLLADRPIIEPYPEDIAVEFGLAA